MVQCSMRENSDEWGCDSAYSDETSTPPNTPHHQLLVYIHGLQLFVQKTRSCCRACSAASEDKEEVEILEFPATPRPSFEFRDVIPPQSVNSINLEPNVDICIAAVDVLREAADVCCGAADVCRGAVDVCREDDGVDAAVDVFHEDDHGKDVDVFREEDHGKDIDNDNEEESAEEDYTSAADIDDAEPQNNSSGKEVGRHREEVDDQDEDDAAHKAVAHEADPA